MTLMLNESDTMLFTSVTDEQSALFSAQLDGLRAFELDGVSVQTGLHPAIGLAIIVAPMSGSHAILSNPFEDLSLFL